ncbi:MAG: hypothetical protein AAF125_08010 [Chloroflexota bacterium]
MSQRYRWNVTVMALITAVVAVMGLGMHANNGAAPARLEWSSGITTLRFEAERDAVWWRGGCTQIAWETSNIQAIWIDGVGVGGVGERSVCVEPNGMPWVRLLLPDGTTYNAELPVTIITEVPYMRFVYIFAGGLLALAVTFAPPARRRLDAMDGSARLSVILVFVIILAGAALRVVYLDRPMRGDESFSIMRFATQPYEVIRADNTDVNNHYLHTMAVRLSRESLGTAAWVARLPAFFAGVLMLPLTYGMARVHYGSVAAMIALLGVAFHPFAVNFSVNARGYTIYAACFIALMWLAAYARGRTPWWVWPLLAMIPAIGFAALTVFLYPMIVFGVVWVGLVLTKPDTSRRVKVLKLLPFGGAMSVGAALTVWFYWPLLSGGLGTLTGSAYIVQEPWTRAPQFVLDSIGRLSGVVGVSSTWGWVVLALFVIAALLRHRYLPERAPTLAVAAVGTLIALVVLRYPMYGRVWLFALPLLFMGIGVLGAVVVRGPYAEAITNAIGLLVAVVSLWGVLSSGVMWRVDGTGDAHGAEAAAQHFAAIVRDNPDADIGVIPNFTAQFAVPFYAEHHRVYPAPRPIGIEFGEVSDSYARRIIDGEPAYLFALYPQVEPAEENVDYYLFQSQTETVDALEIETLDTFEDDWRLRQVIPR